MKSFIVELDYDARDTMFMFELGTVLGAEGSSGGLIGMDVGGVFVVWARGGHQCTSEVAEVSPRLRPPRPSGAEEAIWGHAPELGDQAR